MRRYTLLFVCMLSWPVWVMAQTPAYLHYGVREGLPSNLVYCGIQDQRGLLWFGTDKGLACFDGTRFRTLGIEEGLPDPEVLNLMEDHSGRLWVSSYLKKPCYRRNGRFYTENQDSLLKRMECALALWTFFEDRDSSVWLTGQTDYAARFLKNDIKNIHIPGLIQRAGSIDSTLFLFGVKEIHRMGADGELERVMEMELPAIKPVNPFLGFCISGNRVLYSYIDRLVLMEWRDGRFCEIMRRPGPIGRAFTDSDGRFWICSLAEGAVCFNNKNRDLSNPVNFFKGQKVTAMFDDRQGTHWFCTTDNGVYALPRNVAVNFTEQNGLLSNNLTALTSDPAGRLLAGDDEGNLYEIDRNYRLNTTAIGSKDGYNRIRRILVGSQGRWLIADEGIFYQRGHKLDRVDITLSPKSAILQAEKLWFVSSGGAGYVLEKGLEFFRMTSGRFTSIGEDSEGYIWTGGNQGVYCSADSFRFNWGERFPALASRIVAIERAGPGLLWMATPENGLLRLMVRGGRIDSVEVMNGRLSAPIKNIQSLFVSADGMLWIATNRGIYRLDRNLGIVHLDRHDGLADDDTNTVLARGDTVWAATVGGLSRLILKSPDAAGEFSTMIVQARYRVGSETYDFYLVDSLMKEKRMVLPPSASLFEVELAGLDYRSRGNFRYQCVTTTLLPSWKNLTLDNLIQWVGRGFQAKSDTNWVNSGSLSFGVHLPSGCYRLSITAVTAGGAHSLFPDVLTVEMRPHRYDTIWFVLFLWSLAGYGLWRFLRARSAYRRLDAAVSELRLQALQAQMNPHFIGNSINAIQQFFYPPDPVRASQYISLFNRLLRRTLSFSEKTFIPFSEELAYDRDYLEMVKLRFGDRFYYAITGVEMVPETTPFPSMLLQPLLENATIHGLAANGVSELKLDFYFAGDKLICTITDNGAGFRKTRERQKAAGTARKSKGLEMLHQKVETLNRRYNIGLKLALEDLSDTGHDRHGTRVVIRYSPQKYTPEK